MTKSIFIIVLLLLIISDGIAQKIEESDTTLINYYIAIGGEFGGVNEGLLIFKNNNEFKIKCIKYNVSSYGKGSTNVDSIKNFYRRNKNNYTLMKSEWVLTNQQIDYLNGLISEISSHPTRQGFSNAQEHYVLFTKREDYVFLDSTGEWKKYVEISKVLGIELGKGKQWRKLKLGN